MSLPRPLTRRQILSLLATLAGGRALAGPRAGGGDSGIGGTGLKPGDNGIGGTGFVGTIRKFGSVYVNGERIAYPSNVYVEIDGAVAPPSRMRIGQVARLVADWTEDGGWRTNGIRIVSEAVGPISRIEGMRVVALGQTVQLANAKWARGLKRGDRVAVSGLRRPDQTIVASHIEARGAGADQIAGVLEHGDGALVIGSQPIAGVSEALVGERIIVRGAQENGVFVAQHVSLDTNVGLAQRVSIETWLTKRGGMIETAGGVRVEDPHASLAEGAHLTVVRGTFGADGALIASQVALPNARGDFDPVGRGGGPGGVPSPGGRNGPGSHNGPGFGPGDRGGPAGGPIGGPGGMGGQSGAVPGVSGGMPDLPSGPGMSGGFGPPGFRGPSR